MRAGIDEGVHFISPRHLTNLGLQQRLIECDFLLKVKKYVDDPLNWHGGLKLQWVNAILTAMDKIRSKSSTIKMPYFLACGEADQIVKSDSSKYLDKHTQSKDQTFKVRLDSPGHRCT